MPNLMRTGHTESPPGAPGKAPLQVGQFTLEGTLLNMINTEDLACKVSQRAIWEVGLVDENQMRLVRQLEECGGPRGIITLERVP